MKVIILCSVFFAVVQGQAGGLCYDTLTVNTMCVAGTSLAEKFSAPEVAACSDQFEVSGRSSKSKMRAKKVKCPADCVTVDEHFTNLMSNMSGEACVLQELGWMDSDGAMIEDAWLPDVSLSPVADMVTRKTMKACVKEMKADADFKALRKTCGKCYSNAEEKAMDALEFEFKCFTQLFDGSCADYVNQEIMEAMMVNPESYIWTDEGIVPTKLSEAPASPLTATWESGAVAGINVTIASDDMFERPVVSFDAEADALYTLMITDEGIEDLGGLQFFHWMKVNVPGSDLTGGDENYEYVAPFYFKGNADGTGLIDTGDDIGHDILFLAYKQPGEITVEETQTGCNPDIQFRVNDKAVLAEKYGLEGPVAGTFIWSKYAEGGDFYLCYFTKCTGAAWPFPIPGVNDLAECQA